MTVVVVPHSFCFHLSILVLFVPVCALHRREHSYKDSNSRWCYPLILRLPILKSRKKNWPSLGGLFDIFNIILYVDWKGPLQHHCVTWHPCYKLVAAAVCWWSAVSPLAIWTSSWAFYTPLLFNQHCPLLLGSPIQGHAYHLELCTDTSHIL